MSNEFFEELREELLNGIHKKKHPFRFFTLGTVNALNEPILRTVVLRKVETDLELFFYSDNRSNKVNDILLNENVSALFYHPKKMLQLQIKGNAFIEKDLEILNSLWDKLPLKSRKDYTTSLAPGTKIENPNQVKYLSKENHFCVIKIVPYLFEYLRLKKSGHTRIRFTKKDKNWTREFLVP